jgi:hypothetical protein
MLGNRTDHRSCQYVEGEVIRLQWIGNQRGRPGLRLKEPHFSGRDPVRKALRLWAQNAEHEVFSFDDYPMN